MSSDNVQNLSGIQSSVCYESILLIPIHPAFVLVVAGMLTGRDIMTPKIPGKRVGLAAIREFKVELLEHFSTLTRRFERESFRKDMRARVKFYTTLSEKSADHESDSARYRLLSQVHQEALEAVGDEATPKKRKSQPKTQVRYPNFPSSLPLRLHFLARGSLRRERAVALCEYAGATERQTADTGETLLSVALSEDDVWLFERLVETLGGSGLGLPAREAGGFETSDGRKGSVSFTEAASRMADDNNYGRAYGWQFEKGPREAWSPPIPTGKSHVPNDLPWDPDPVFQDILEKTLRDDLDAALIAVEAIDPTRREILFDEVLYLKFCVRAPITAQDLRYIALKYIKRSSVGTRLEEEFDSFLESLDPLLRDRNDFESLAHPWDQLIPWPEFRANAYRDLELHGHPSWPRGRLFVWHPDLYARSADYFDRSFIPDLVEAENIFRRARGIPEIGRGWASEAALFDLVKSRFPDAVFQWSPHWLGRQSVDIYIPSIGAAVEYQGEQHYGPIDIFGGEEGFISTQRRDALKRERLARQGVSLIEWRFDTPISGAELERALSLIVPVGHRSAIRTVN